MNQPPLTLPEQIEKIAREMCKDLGLDPDEYYNGDYGRLRRWSQFKAIIRKNLENDAYLRAKDKLDRKKL